MATPKKKPRQAEGRRAVQEAEGGRLPPGHRHRGAVGRRQAEPQGRPCSFRALGLGLAALLVARTPVLGGSGLSPFGGGGANFGAFDVVDPGREAYLGFLKVKVDWEQGLVSNANYLTAYQTYVSAQTPGTSTRIDAEQSLRDTKYRLERNDLLAAVENGQRTWSDLLEYDRSKLVGLDHSSQEYLDRVNLYQQTQAKGLSDAASDQHDLYDAGKITTTQLRSWYAQQAVDPHYAGNPDLQKNIADQIRSLDLRVQGEQDNHMVQLFNDGKVGSSAFLVYAAAAQARYGTGTEQAQQWSKLITDAKQQVAEKGLTYRYGLSQHYIDLQKFIKDNTDMLARQGAGSTSTSTRIVLGADGQWKEVTSTKSSPYKPSAAEVKAMADRRIELADAKRQLAEVNSKIGANGGFVTTDSMISFYTNRQASFVKGTAEWYQVQERLDSLQQQKHQEQVLKAEGVRVTYGGAATSGSGSAPKAASAATSSTSSTSSKATSVDAFMRSIAVSESGGNYSATNKSSGAYGKYQIMPANWPSWAAKYLGDGSAPTTPENQEKVARGKMLDLYKWLGSWDRVAHWWLTGSSDPNKANWSASSTRYVNAVMGRLGSAPIATGGTTKLGTTATAAAKGPLQVVTSVRTAPKGGSVVKTVAASFPTNLDGSAFTKFYSGFNAAFDAGETTFTDFSSGRAVTYSIPADLEKRIVMMNALDDLRISYYAKRAEVYAGTPSEFTAANEYSNAIKDKADNAYTILITAQPKGSTPAPGRPLVDPIAQGLAVQTKAELYVKDQLAAAKLSYARGDITGAYSHIQLAQRTMAETDAKMQVYAHEADAAMQAIAGASGESAPDKVAGDFAKLIDWQSSASLTSSLKDMDKLQGEIIGDPASNKPGWAEVDAHGNPVWTNGQVRLRDGAAVFLDESGTVTYKDIPSAGYAKPGSKEQVPAIPGYVAITMNAGGSVVGDQSGGVTAYAQWHSGVVGFTSSGAPIYGKVVSGTLNGKRYTYGEDPFHPGKWAATNMTFAVPPDFKAIPGTVAGATVYQFSKDGVQYRLDWDDKAGQYNLIKPGNLLGGVDTVLPIGDADTQALVSGAGFRVDLSGVALGDQWQFNMTGAHPGFDRSSFEEYTQPKLTPASAAVPGRIRRDAPFALERTMARRDQIDAVALAAQDDQREANRISRTSQQPGALGPSSERQDWNDAQIARQASLPNLTRLGPSSDREPADTLRSVPTLPQLSGSRLAALDARTAPAPVKPPATVAKPPVPPPPAPAAAVPATIKKIAPLPVVSKTSTKSIAF
jgi:hypothetical protein